MSACANVHHIAVQWYLSKHLHFIELFSTAGSGYIRNWSEIHCVPSSVSDFRSLYLPVIGVVETIGILANTLVLLSFLYVITCTKRIRRKFGRTRLTYMRQPIFILVCHLSTCDLLYCLVGLPTYW